MFTRILIANRGEIAARIMRTAQRLGIECVAVYSDADASASYVKHADMAVNIGPAPATESYLRIDRIIDAAKATGAQAIHPGYGFLSENPDFVDAIVKAGLVFIGPSAQAIRSMGLKDAAKSLMQEADVPVVPGYHGSRQEPEFLAQEAQKIGYPVLIKARAGGGGKGMRLVESADQFVQALASAAREGQSAFGDPRVLLEKYISSPRHIEVQIVGDAHGNVLHLYERDCSLQRRHQKVIEEAPAPNMPQAVRDAMTQAAIKAAKAIDYCGAGTVEFIVDATGALSTEGFWFMEMNTRLQVEHPITEAITGLDLVEIQLQVAAGDALGFNQSDVLIQGHAFEARLYAEDVQADFLPATGTLQHVHFSQHVRVDSAVYSGDAITPYYDPMIAKLVSYDCTRSLALAKLGRALGDTHIAGTITNIQFLKALCQQAQFVDASMDTTLIDQHLSALTEQADVPELARLLAALALLQIDTQQCNCGWRLFGQASHLISLHDAQQSCERRLLVGKEGGGANGCVQLQAAHQSDVLASVRDVVIGDTYIRFRQNSINEQAGLYRWMEGSTAKVSILLEGVQHTFSTIDPRDGVAVSLGDPDTVQAPMTGVVRVMEAHAGQQIKAGQTVLVMEAMKMETSLKSPRDGQVKAIFCTPGDTVEGGSVLIALEAEH